MTTKQTKEWKIISVGGSIIIPPSGFDVHFLEQFRSIILTEVKKGKKFILVIGGGATARLYQGVARSLGLTDTELDWIGIQATRMNAELVKHIFGGHAHTSVITNPTKKVKTNKKIIIASGWKPGCSTDKDAVLLAKAYGAKQMINLSNIDYVYDSDPKVNPAAKRLEAVHWKELQKIVGTKWIPGANVPFDPTAVALAAKQKLVVHFAKGTDLEAMRGAINGDQSHGTVIQ